MIELIALSPGASPSDAKASPSGEGSGDFAALLNQDQAPSPVQALLTDRNDQGPVKMGMAHPTAEALPFPPLPQQALTIAAALPTSPEGVAGAVQMRPDARMGPQRAAATALGNAAPAAGLAPAEGFVAGVPAPAEGARRIAADAPAAMPAPEAEAMADRNARTPGVEARQPAASSFEFAKAETVPANAQTASQAVQTKAAGSAAAAEPSFSMPAAGSAEPALAGRTQPGAVLTAAPQLNPQAQAAMVQIAEAISIRAQERSITLRLDPPELGTVKIEMAFDQKGGVTAILAADQPDTTQLLRRHADWLQRELAAAGFAEATIAWDDAGAGDGRADTPWQRLLLTREAGPAVGGPDIVTLPASSVVPGRIDLRL